VNYQAGELRKTGDTAAIEKSGSLEGVTKRSLTYLKARVSPEKLKDAFGEPTQAIITGMLPSGLIIAGNYLLI